MRNEILLKKPVCEFVRVTLSNAITIRERERERERGNSADLLTGHNTVRRHLYVMGLSNNPIRRKCGNEEENLVHILCACEALASLMYSYLRSFFLDPEDIRLLVNGAIWNVAKRTGLL